MNDPLFVRGSQSECDLLRVVQRLAYRQRPLTKLGAQFLAVEQFGNDVGGATVSADIKNGENIGMVQHPGSASFLLEAPQSIFIRRECSRQDFDRDLAPKS